MENVTIVSMTEEMLNGSVVDETELTDDSSVQVTCKLKTEEFPVTTECHIKDTVMVEEPRSPENENDIFNGSTSDEEKILEIDTTIDSDEGGKSKDSLSDTSHTTLDESTTGVTEKVNVEENSVLGAISPNMTLEKQSSAADILKVRKVYVLKEDIEISKTENPAKTNGENAPESALSSETKLVNGDAETTIEVASQQSAKPNNGPKFVSLTQGNLRNISPKISLSVTPSVPRPILPKVPQSQSDSAAKKFDILRNRLLESGITSSAASSSQSQSSNPSSQSSSRRESQVISRKVNEEPPAVAKAKEEYKKYRNLLIQTAVCPQLPTYKPPASYAGPTYSCEECKDTFTYSESLLNHLNRRSVLFTYACPQCKTTLEFYNRCTFFLHVRSHDAAVKACRLTISTIPADKLNFTLLQTDNEDEVLLTDNKLPKIKYRSVSVTRKDNENDATASIADKNETCTKNVTHSIAAKLTASCSLTVSKSSSMEAEEEDSESETTGTSSSDESENEAEMKDRRASVECSITNEKVNVVAAPEEKKPQNSELKRHLTTAVTITNSKMKYKRKPSEDECTPNKKAKLANENATAATPAIQIKPNGTTSVSVSRVPANAVSSIDEIALTSSDDEEDEIKETEKAEGKEKVICRDCKIEVTNLTKHYRANGQPQKEYPCESCKFFNPSSCALAAHTRMHTKTSPFICPDCGFYFNNLDTFQTHIKQVCFYDYKTIRFQCPECPFLKTSVMQFAEHLKRCHTRDVYKCSLCITSSYSPKIVQTHMRQKHESYETGTIVEGNRCMLCPNILVPKRTLAAHINKHATSLQYLRYVYICKLCKKYACRSMKKFIRHVENCPDKKRVVLLTKNKPSVPSKNGTAVTSATTSTNTTTTTTTTPTSTVISIAKPGAVKLTPKSKPGPRKLSNGIDTWNGTDPSKGGGGAKICIMCQTGDMEDSNSLFCNACVRYVNAEDASNETSSNSATTNSETRPDGRPKRKFKCKLCKMLINRDWATITQHYKENHNANLSDANSHSNSASKAAKLTKDAESKKPSSDLSAASATPASPAAVNLLKKRKSSLSPKPEKVQLVPMTWYRIQPDGKVVKIENPDAEEVAVRVTPAATAVNVKKYKCVRCGFESESRDEFHVHIGSHKNTDIQCLECGECFIVKPTLEKHLIVVHKVKDVHSYFVDNGLETVENLEENQCIVCYLKCGTKANYDRHIRTHGMAFVALQSRMKEKKNIQD